jgi:hypothetical protein
MYRQYSNAIDVVSDDLICSTLLVEIEEDKLQEKTKAYDRETKQNEMTLKVIYNKESLAFNVNRKYDTL